VGDADGDGVVDPFDNCSTVSNSDQRDENGNAAGDACDLGVLGFDVRIEVQPSSPNASSRAPVGVALMGGRRALGGRRGPG
jgi:hypothetical protein